MTQRPTVSPGGLFGRGEQGIRCASAADLRLYYNAVHGLGAPLSRTASTNGTAHHSRRSGTQQSSPPRAKDGSAGDRSLMASALSSVGGLSSAHQSALESTRSELHSDDDDDDDDGSQSGEGRDARSQMEGSDSVRDRLGLLSSQRDDHSINGSVSPRHLIGLHPDTIWLPGLGEVRPRTCEVTTIVPVVTFGNMGPSLHCDDPLARSATSANSPRQRVPNLFTSFRPEYGESDEDE